MALNQSALNEWPLNETENSNPELASITGKVSIVGEPFQKTDPVGLFTIVGLAYPTSYFSPIAILGIANQRNQDGKICIIGQANQRNVDGAICIVSVIRELPIAGGPHNVGTSTPTGVLPETGSAIFSVWQPMLAKEILTHRHFSFHESGRVDFDDTRRGWRLEMEVNETKHNEVVTFFNSHVWAGKAFYFYDLQANGFQYDATGVLTSGRYKVRFVDEQFPRFFRVGKRFRIPFSIIEVD